MKKAVILAPPWSKVVALVMLKSVLSMSISAADICPSCIHPIRTSTPPHPSIHYKQTYPPEANERCVKKTPRYCQSRQTRIIIKKKTWHSRSHKHKPKKKKQRRRCPANAADRQLTTPQHPTITIFTHKRGTLTPACA